MVKIIIFDINENLDICEIVKKPDFLIPTKEVFDSLRKKGYLIALTSGLPHWYQQQLANENNIIVNFVCQKHEIRTYMNSIALFNRNCNFKEGDVVNVEAILVGNNDEDKFFAWYNNIDYLDKHKFMEKFKKDGI